MIKPNTCGDCSLCCSVLPIPEIGKLPGLMCGSCSGTSCNIYKDRPVSCVNFNCAYLEEDMDEELRPDKLGIIFEKVTTKIWLAICSINNLEAWDKAEAREAFKGLNDKGITVVVTAFAEDFNKKIFLAPQHDQEKVINILMSFT